MKTHISDFPAQDAGVYISQKLKVHVSENVLLLLSGGSALEVTKYIDVSLVRSEQTITIATTDERFTFDENGNNYTQLQETVFYKSAKERNVCFMSSKPIQGEDLTAFTKRLRMSFEDYYSDHPHAYTIALLGIGEDGHTASIFGAPEQAFKEQYMVDELYVSIANENLQYPYRTTITPSFIEEKIDDVVLFAIGSTKCDNILNYMHNKNFSSHQIPALIPAQHPQSILFTDCQTLL